MSTAFAQMKQLSAAIAEGNIMQVRQLLAAHNVKQIVNLPDQDLYTSLFHTVKINNQDAALEILSMLLQKGANPYHKEENGQTILSYMAKQGKIRLLEKMLSSFNFDLSDLDKFQQTPLYWAASFGRLKIAQLLIRYGCNINQLDQNGETCLFYAARDGQLEMCKFLINRGCKHDLVDKNKKTPLHFAKQFKHPAVVDYLVSLKGIKAKAPKEKESNHESKPEKKKKQAPRHDYVLIYTNEEGVVNQVTAQEIDEFPLKSDFHAKLWEYFLHPQKLEEVDTKGEKKATFIRTATKLLNSYLKRHDLALFHFPVDTNIFKDYPQHVDKPMDFSTMRIKLNNNCYENEEEFRDDIVLIYDNCIKYNGELSIYGQMSKNFKMEFLDTFRKEFPL